MISIVPACSCAFSVSPIFYVNTHFVCLAKSVGIAPSSKVGAGKAKQLCMATYYVLSDRSVPGNGASRRAPRILRRDVNWRCYPQQAERDFIRVYHLASYSRGSTHPQISPICAIKADKDIARVFPGYCVWYTRCPINSF